MSDPMSETPVGLGRRPLDLLLVGFFGLNLLVITYLFDLEQVIVADPSHFEYPVFPPRFMLDLAHWWERNFDPLLWARPTWYQATIWIDLVGFGPFYAVAIYAFTRGREWIRVPAIVWASVMLTNVTIILSEEIWGPFASPKLWAVVAANASWIVIPVLVIARVSSQGPLFRSAP
jgi:hypothetical protein